MAVKTTGKRGVTKRKSRGTPQRSVRVPDKLWDAALAKTKKNGETLASVITEALQSYVDNTAA